MNKKVAFMTMDVETINDTQCLKEKGIELANIYRYEESILAYAALLEKYNIRGTFFVMSDSLEYSKEYLNMIKEKHDIALHGFHHISPLKLDNERFDTEIKEAKKAIKEQLDLEVKGYRAPCFGIDDERLLVIRKNGFTYDSSSLDFYLADDSGKVDLREYKKINDTVYSKDDFYEMKISLVKAYNKHLPVSGGGYLRLIPWFVIKYYLKKYIRTHDSYVFYVHPFEISKNKIPFIKGIKRSKNRYFQIGRKSYLRKIEKIINLLIKEGYEFKGMDEVVS